MSRRLTYAIVGAVMGFVPIAFASLPAASAAVANGAANGAEPPTELYGSGKLTAPDPTSIAVSYSPGAPIGATLTVNMTSSAGSTVAELQVSRLLPDRGYAVHAHTNACGATGKDAGPHYQNRIDPAATPQTPSADPAYANPNNEIWLDVARTDPTGSARSQTTVPFVFTDRAPGSIVVHEAMATATDPGHAGQAGTRLACLTLSRR